MTKGNMTEILDASVSHAGSLRVGDVVDGNSKTATSKEEKEKSAVRFAKGEG